MSYPPGPPRGYSPPDPSRDRFTRGGFAPLPHRHEADSFDRYVPPPPGPPPGREREPFPIRERDLLPPLPGAAVSALPPRRGEEYDAEVSRWERRLDRERDRDEWEERDWEKERERDMGRGRRPPPHWEEDFDRPKRRRSPSPGYPSHRPRRFSPDPYSHPPHPGHSIPLGSNLPDPASLPHQLTFKQFAEWFRVSHPSTAKADEEEFRRFKAGEDVGLGGGGGEEKGRVGMGKRYERYRKEYTSRQLYSLYLMHRSSPWFSERYSLASEDQAMRRRVNRQGRIPTVEKYLDDLKSGKFDSISYDQPDEQHSKRPNTSRRYSELEEPDGLDRALGDDGVAEPGKLEIPPKAKQVFVKSVPPTISRKELEELFSSCDGFEYLALTEPSVKKAFHRVAWAQYSDETDIEAVVKKLDESKIDNFTFHMGVNVAPTVGRVRYTPPNANTLARLIKDGEKAQALAVKLEEELLGDEEEVAPAATEAPAAAAPIADEAEVKEEKKETLEEEGDKLGETESKPVTAGIAKLAGSIGLREAGSAVVLEVLGRQIEAEGLDGEELTDEQQIKKAKLTLDHWISYLRNGLSTCYYCVAPMSFAEELQRKCIGHLRSPASKEEGLEAVPEREAEVKDEGEEIKVDDAENAGAERERDGEREREKDEDADVDVDVDREGRDAGEREGGGGSRRDGRDRERDRGDREGRDRGSKARLYEERWEEMLDMKLGPVLGEVDVVEYGGRNVDEETRKLTAPYIKQEEANKYRCKECNKLFKAPEFVMKHITVKHGEHVQGKLDEIATFNTFVLDPQHLQPTIQVPAAVDDALPQMGMGMGMNMGTPIMNPAFANSSNMSNSALANANPQQQMMFMMMQMQQAMMMQMANNGMGPVGMGAEGRGLAGRMGGFASGGGGGGGGGRSRDAEAAPLPPMPAGGEDPRAKRGRVSYMDLDEMGSGGGAGGGGRGGAAGAGGDDGGLPY